MAALPYNSSSYGGPLYIGMDTANGSTSVLIHMGNTKKFTPKGKSLKEIDIDDIEAEDYHLFYIEKYYNHNGEWKYYKGAGVGKNGLKKAKRSVERIGTWQDYNSYFRIVRVNLKQRKPIGHVKR